MLIKCPSCGAAASLDALIDNKSAAKALEAALRLSKVGSLLIKYIALFRPEKRQLSWAKVESLLGEIGPMIEFQRIQRDGLSYIVPITTWERAITIVLEARDAGHLRTPLKSHGYLMEVIVGELNKAAKDAEKRDQERRQKERQDYEQKMQAMRQAQQERDNPPKARDRTPMPSNVKAVFTDIFKKVQQENALLTPEQLELKKKAELEKVEKLMTPEQIARKNAMKAKKAKMIELQPQ